MKLSRRGVISGEPFMTEGFKESEEMLPQKYWGEKEWERSMLESERLMDRYEQVIKNHPNRKWRDPFVLYMMVHEGIDLGDGPPAQSEETEISSAEEALEFSDLEREIPTDCLKDGLEEVPVYRQAFSFVLDLNHWLESGPSGFFEKHVILQTLYRHALRVPADIAGGHGLGYDEETLCGNIVKNRWALRHARKVQRLLKDWSGRPGVRRLPVGFCERIDAVILALIDRVQVLRSRVWWA
jgi:hypothetical protein